MCAPGLQGLGLSEDLHTPEHLLCPLAQSFVTSHYLQKVTVEMLHVRCPVLYLRSLPWREQRGHGGRCAAPESFLQALRLRAPVG